MVAPGPSWARETFDRFVADRTTLRLSAGCEVWLALAPSDAALGGEKAYFTDGSEPSRSVGVTLPRTRLGRGVGPSAAGLRPW